MAKITVDDISLYYETQGQGEPLVFIPGFSVDHLMWQQTASSFADSYQTIVFDNRGSGQSDCPDAPYTVEMMATDVIHLCKSLNLNKCHFVGSSMGAGIAQTLAVKYPDFVRSITLVNPFTHIDIRFALFAQAQLEFYKAGVLPEAMIKAVLGWVFSSEFLQQEGVVEFLINMGLSNPYPMTETGYRNQLHALLNFNSEPWLQQISVPCCVIGSDQDAIVSETRMRQMADNIPNALYYGVQGVGHLPFVENPEVFNEVLRDFLFSHAYHD